MYNHNETRSIYAKVPQEIKAKRKEERAKGICLKYIEEKLSLRRIASMYGLSHEQIRQILIGNGIEVRHRVCDQGTPIGTEKVWSGYIHVYIGEGALGANRQGWIPKHRLVMQRKLGRVLYPWEIVHHIDRNKLNNKPSNLKVMSPENHPTCLHCPYYKYFVRVTGKKTFDKEDLI